MLYVRLVRPHLEYVNPVWNPYLKKHIDMIENIQRRATKLPVIPGLSDLSYEDRLRRLKLPSLSYRRSRGDMIEVYKIMSGQGSQNCMWAWWSYWKECQSSLIFYCKIPNLCQSLVKSAQILLVMSDRTDTSHKLWMVNMEAGQIGPKPNRPQVKSAPSQIGPIFVVYYCQHAKLNSLNTIQQNI